MWSLASTFPNILHPVKGSHCWGFNLMDSCSFLGTDVITLKALVVCWNSFVSVCPVLQEAVSTGDPEMVQLVLQRRDYLKASTALGGVPELLSKIREVRLLQFANVPPSICTKTLNYILATKVIALFTLSSTVSRLLHGNEVGVYQLE